MKLVKSFSSSSKSYIARQFVKQPKKQNQKRVNIMVQSQGAGLGLLQNTETFDSVQNYYGKILTTSKDLKTNACTASGKPHPIIQSKIKDVPKEVLSKFYGCGSPLPLGIQGLRILDLGSGSGRDCYVCSALVGESGQVTGLDMTEEQLDVARVHADEYCQKTLGFSKTNMNFVKGNIEYLDKAGIADESIDIIISNCVINLSPDKPRVLREAYRVLAEGGEFYFSDVYCDRRLSEAVQKDEVLWGECISGALYTEDFKRIARDVGFADVRTLSVSEMEVNDAALRDVLGEARFFSISYRLFKVSDKMESTREDYGQIAIYKGTIEGNKHSYTLDDSHTFITGKPVLVDGNTAAMVGEGGTSWLSHHFDIVGDRSVHYGLFGQSADSSSGQVLEGPPLGKEKSSCATDTSSYHLVLLTQVLVVRDLRFIANNSKIWTSIYILNKFGIIQFQINSQSLFCEILLACKIVALVTSMILESLNIQVIFHDENKYIIRDIYALYLVHLMSILKNSMTKILYETFHQYFARICCIR
eukprot:TRINITY_DN956_c0_g1_i6.p1 TRINITY_DN956_c0_g1~~TRINITY_DN956_c0_g1_i6.p1  ORF type:complete len:531 (-),score=56.56 TRINITY_DN956_c0_g1_i6:121-1713(-)